MISSAVQDSSDQSHPAFRCAQVDGLQVIWTSTASNSDLEGRLLRISRARIGHLHFHTNVNEHRIQVWILETKGWEEHAVIRRKKKDIVIEEMVCDSYWVGLVRNALRNS